MKLIRPSFEIIEQRSGQQGMIQHIEKCGRTCYKSEDKITNDSAYKFVDMIINRGHTAMLEHGTVYLKVDNTMGGEAYRIQAKYDENEYSEVVEVIRKDDLSNRGIPYTCYYITTNFRVITQNKWLSDLEYLCEPTEYHIKRYTVKFVCDRGISHEFVRHRVFSFAQESTRYCNYNRDRFNKECVFIIPEWFKTLKEADDEELLKTYSKEKVEAGMNRYYAVDNNENEWVQSMLDAEMVYNCSIENGWTPQQARSVLPNSLKTELVMTGTIEQWEEFFKLRCAPDAHPQAKELAIPLKEYFINNGICKN